MPPKANDFYKEPGKLQEILIDIHKISEGKPEMAGTPQNDKQVPYLMEAHYSGKGVGFFKGIYQGTDAVKDPAHSQPDETNGFNDFHQGINDHHAKPPHHQINPGGNPPV